MWIIHTYYKLKHFYNGLSNRVLWILILLTIFLVWFILYWYVFVLSLYSVNFETNVKNYNIELINEKFKKKYLVNCSLERCELKDIAKLNYDVTISKELYNTVKFSFNPSIKNNFKIILFKKAILRPIIEEKELKKELTRNEKIALINKKHNNFLYKEIEDKEFILKDQNNKLDLYFNNNFVYSFEKLENNKFYIAPVYNSNKYFFISNEKEKIILDSNFLKIIKLKLNIKILYVKKLNDLDFLLVTDKWSFIFNIKKKTYTYFNSLYDFVILDNWDYIWVLKDNLNSQKSNLWFTQKWDLIVYYSSKTKKARLLIAPDFDVSKIYKENNWIIIEDKTWNKYELLNY